MKLFFILWLATAVVISEGVKPSSTPGSSGSSSSSGGSSSTPGSSGSSSSGSSSGGSSSSSSSSGLSANAACLLQYNVPNGNGPNNPPYYEEISNPACGDGLTCVPNTYDESLNDQDTTSGTCQSSVCEPTVNKKNGANPQANDATIRVTICHRTCSEKNPWVRITIDDDGWNGTMASGCGHQQHNVIEDCNANVKDFSAWGSHRADYLLKWHGTRQEIADSLCGVGKKNCQAEKNYWKQWEHACPYVRGDGCCDWNEGSCCGDQLIVTGCPAAPMDDFTSTVYVTYSNAPSSLPTINFSQLADAFKNYYNTLSRSSCDPFMRELTSVTYVSGSVVKAMTPNGALEGFRCAYEVAGKCSQCDTAPLFKGECTEAVVTNCCPNGSKAPDGRMMAEASGSSQYPIIRVVNVQDVHPTECAPVPGKTVMPYVDFDNVLKCFFVASS